MEVRLPVDEISQGFDQFLAKPWFQWGQRTKLKKQRVRVNEEIDCYYSFRIPTSSTDGVDILCTQFLT